MFVKDDFWPDELAKNDSVSSSTFSSSSSTSTTHNAMKILYAILSRILLKNNFRFRPKMKLLSQLRFACVSRANRRRCRCWLRRVSASRRVFDSSHSQSREEEICFLVLCVSLVLLFFTFCAWWRFRRYEQILLKH